MSKRLFNILDELNAKDCDDGKRRVAMSNSFISAKKVKLGAQFVMGADEQCLHDVMNDKCIAILLVIDRDEYKKATGK